MALSRADMVKNKCLSYQKRTPKEKSLKSCTRDSASISWVTARRTSVHLFTLISLQPGLPLVLFK